VCDYGGDENALTLRNEDRSERMDEIVLPHWKQQIEQAQTLYNARHALMNKDKFNRIRRAASR
jgi:hypothetical protein